MGGSQGNGREKLETPLVECPWDVAAAQVKVSAEQPEVLEKYWQCQMAAAPSPLRLQPSMRGLSHPLCLPHGWVCLFVILFVGPESSSLRCLQERCWEEKCVLHGCVCTGT